MEKAEEAAKIKESLEMSFWTMPATEKAKKERVDIGANIKNIRKVLNSKQK